ncbi:MAG TPA: hypothetical protein VEI73_06880 [Candidatus Acidoferrum sp.]|nr:hypothetical protein [Candidatus Acidoferrum sp.]
MPRPLFASVAKPARDNGKEKSRLKARPIPLFVAKQGKQSSNSVLTPA